MCVPHAALVLGVVTAAAAAAALVPAAAARAAYIIVVQQVGSTVTATGTGSLDTADLTPLGIGQVAGSSIVPNTAFIVVGPTTTTQFTEWNGFTGGPASFGTGGSSGTAPSGSGQIVGITGTNHILVIPTGYLSGSDLGTSTDTWTNRSLSSLGLTPGTYTYAFGTAPHADTFTVQVNPAPEPATASLLLAPAAALALTRGRRRSRRHLPVVPLEAPSDDLI